MDFLSFFRCSSCYLESWHRAPISQAICISDDTTAGTDAEWLEQRQGENSISKTLECGFEPRWNALKGDQNVTAHKATLLFFRLPHPLKDLEKRKLSRRGSLQLAEVKGSQNGLEVFQDSDFVWVKMMKYSLRLTHSFQKLFTFMVMVCI